MIVGGWRGRSEGGEEKEKVQGLFICNVLARVPYCHYY